MTPLHPYAGDEKHSPSGANPQANAWLRKMVKQGLVRKLVDGSYEITEAGKILARQFQQQEG